MTEKRCDREGEKQRTERRREREEFQEEKEWTEGRSTDLWRGPCLSTLKTKIILMKYKYVSKG